MRSRGVGFGGRREAVVVVAFDGLADGVAPVVGVERFGVFVLGDGDGLQENLRHVGDSAGGSGFYITADNGGDEASQGGAEIAGREVVAGEEVGQVFAERFFGEGAGFFLGVVEAEVGIFAGARSAAAAAFRERKPTQGRAVLDTERRHKSLLRVEFWDCLLKEAGFQWSVVSFQSENRNLILTFAGKPAVQNRNAPTGAGAQ
jgi:hypothetical protein